MHRNASFSLKIIKNLLGGGYAPPLTPPSVGKGAPSSHTHPLREPLLPPPPWINTKIAPAARNKEEAVCWWVMMMCVESLCQSAAVSSADERIYADRDDCRSYFYCFAGHVHRSTCSAGLYFHSDLQSCHQQRPRTCRSQPQRSSGCFASSRQRH